MNREIWQTEQVREKLRMLTRLLPPWFTEHKRDLPWRDTGDPYDVWLSEIMLQQTRVEAVRGYFLRFREALPDISSLAACPDERLLKLWEGLGYYSRVRNLKKCAQVLEAEYGGRLPADHGALLKLPGIGPYTAGAIASIAFSLPVSAVDGNVLRVYARIAGDDSDIAMPETKKNVEKALGEAIAKAAETADGFDPGIFNQALMELGAIICVPNGAPLCDSCPVREICAAFREGQIDKLPVKSGKKARRIEERTIMLLQDGDRFLIKKRPPKGLLAGMYEFPSLEGYRSEAEVLAAVKEAGFDAVHIRKLPDAKHIFTHVEWHMRGYLIKLAAQNRTGDQLFVTKEETEEQYAIPSAFSAYAKALQIEQGADRVQQKRNDGDIL
ncbi:MAG: A/G-specific adenine glycosylase [Eubacteriales bacterium]|nr:A/G-specific adenine glycosylase [Eubacteriales bacterium]